MDWGVFWLVILALIVLDALNDWAKKAEKKAKRDKGFITPPQKPPGRYQRFKAWERRHKKKLWALAIIVGFIVGITW